MRKMPLEASWKVPEPVVTSSRDELFLKPDIFPELADGNSLWMEKK